MKEIKDANGQAWRVSLNGYTMKQVKDEAGIDLWKVFDDEKVLADVYADPAIIIDVIFVLTEDEREKRQTTPKEFYSVWFGDFIEQASKALFDEILDFAPNPKRRAALRKALGKMDEMDDLIIEYGEKQIETLDIKTMVIQELKKHSGDLPESPE